MAEYLPDHGGRWLTAVRDEAMLVLPAERRDDLLALWPRLDGDAAAHVIDRLAGSGITAAPSFALVVREPATGIARALVRGDLRVTLGEVEVSAAGVSTWQERAVEGRPDARVVVAGGEDAEEATRLPILEGVVAASVVEWSVGGATARPAPVVAAAERPTERAAEPVAPVEPAVDAASSELAAEPVVPDERTMVPEDTIVGVSRTERPTFDRHEPSRVGAAAVASQPPSTDASVVAPVIVPPDFGSAPPARPEPAAPPAPATGPAAPALGDHDGLTVAAADLRRLRERRDADVVREPAASAPTSPPLALRMPDGSIEPIVGELVLGRAPAIGRVAGTRVPRPVVIGAGDPDISRTHLRVAVEGGTVVVTDLDSRNGTQVVAPGQPPLRLRPSEATPVLPDTVIDLGGGWSIQVVTR
ncbi:FHA domain-containing protein [Agromyces bracchium]|uniref:FHA domain-containing protein n=1 Tax=Agromyces bracchium TaxID=88376 RepID=A0A6I3MAV6_9MICO|nr:FHA domain-containing protein [Agromyces bracchium]MTH69262.1 FHA domain-containing protein [Agromyces bracchium]